MSCPRPLYIPEKERRSPSLGFPILPPPSPLSGSDPKTERRMGRGVSSGGGQSSLGYLFGSGEAPKPAAEPVQKPAPPPPVDNSKQVPAGIQGTQANNYFRADGQNSGNFITLTAGAL
ncbi:protein SPIRAL1-like 3 isoform X2 [Elaeis guineensis]|uniref:protein SPIRAL1-like 3 isoform X2 n=1 Tax=Elaeis guineensis var. tenera TaxID=51953 RepID=UPI003C6D3D0C